MAPSMRIDQHTWIRSYLAALAGGEAEAIGAHYHDGAKCYGPFGWPRSSVDTAGRLAELASRLERQQIAATDVFASADGTRLALRLVRYWHEGGHRCEAVETRYLRLADDRIIEEFAGPNTFQLADRELSRWAYQPVHTAPDPQPAVLWADEAGTYGAAPRTVPERFVAAFGSNDPEALLALYHPDFVLYSPIAWGMAGREPLVPFVQQFHEGFPGIRLSLFDQFVGGDDTRVAFRFGMQWHNTGTFFGHPPTGDEGVHAEFHSLRLTDGLISEQVVTDISYGIPKYELTVWRVDYPQNTADPAPTLILAGER